MKHSTTVQSINTFEFERIEVPIPDLDLQGRIIDLLDAAHSVRNEKHRKADAQLACIDSVVLDASGIKLPEKDDGRLANRIFYTNSSRITADRFDPNFSKPYFTGFEEAVRKVRHSRLGEIARFAEEVWDQESHFPISFPYVEISGIDLETGEICEVSQIETEEAPSRAKLIVRKGDILVSTTRPNRGAITIVWDEHDFHIASTGFAVIRDVAGVSKKYLLTLLRHRIGLTQMDKRSSGGNYPAITYNELQNVLIPIPPIEIQNDITDQVDTIYAEAKRLREEGDAILANAKAEVEKMILGEN